MARRQDHVPVTPHIKINACRSSSLGVSLSGFELTYVKHHHHHKDCNPMTTTDPSTTPPDATPPSLVDLVNQAEADLATFQAAAITAAASAAKAQADKTTADSAKAVAHTDFVNLANAVAAADPGAPGVTQAMASFKKFGALANSHR
jgi:hypothetical protein